MKMIFRKEYKERSKKRAEDFTRERKMPFAGVMLIIISLVKGTLQKAVREFVDEAKKKLKCEEICQQSMSDARAKIKWEAFEELYEVTAKGMYEDGDYETYEGYRVFGVDGSDLQLPNMPEIREKFGENKGCAMGVTTTVYDLLNGTIASAGIEKYRVGEREMAENLLKKLPHRTEKDLVILDRGYPSKELFEFFEEKELRFLMRVKRGFNKKIDRFKSGMCRIKIGEAYYTVIKFKLKSGKMETLITNLAERTWSVEKFKKLYFMRWGIETKYDMLKNKITIENWSGYSENSIKQDFFAHMFFANIANCIYLDSMSELEQNPENKYEYKININEEIGVLRSLLLRAMLAKNKKESQKLFDEITRRVARCHIPIIPDRQNPRKNSNSRRKFHHNRKCNL